MSTFFFNFSLEGFGYDAEDARIHRSTQVHDSENLLLKGHIALLQYEEALVASDAVEHRGNDCGRFVLDKIIEETAFQVLEEIQGCGLLGKRCIQKG